MYDDDEDDDENSKNSCANNDEWTSYAMLVALTGRVRNIYVNYVEYLTIWWSYFRLVNAPEIRWSIFLCVFFVFSTLILANGSYIDYVVVLWIFAAAMISSLFAL